MKKEQGFSLIELLIVVAIIAIIAAIAVPSMLSSRMAANEAAAIQGCRTVGSAEMAFASTNNQYFENDLTALVTAGYIDERFNGAFNGYEYTAGDVNGTTVDNQTGTGFGFVAAPVTPDSTGRYSYGIGTDQVVRFQEVAGTAPAPKCGPIDCTEGAPIGKQSAS